MVLMHTRGNPKTMTDLAVYKDVVREVKEALEERVQVAKTKGLFRWQIILDPGIVNGYSSLPAIQGLALQRRRSIH